mgnify:CR=1 FL=1|tara:strand:+ start:1962 stop:2717 length:756 start_codon:yes stop_codon:yes gene_type:complete
MSWFNILKNEMRSINLPKFKVKPFNVNKPDEEDNDCKDRFLNEVLKKSEQIKLVHNNPKGSIQSLFDEIEKMADEGRFQYLGMDSMIDDDELFYAKLHLYPTLSDGFADPDTHVEVYITEDSHQDIDQDVNEIPEEVYCKALDMISKGSPQRFGQYDRESVGDWKIQYKNNDLVMEDPTGIRIRKLLTITITKGEVDYITLWNALSVRTSDFGNMWKTGQDNAPIGWDTSKGVAAALSKIESHFEDVKIEW